MDASTDEREEVPNAFNPYVQERSIGGPGTLCIYVRLWGLFGIDSDIISWSDLLIDAINYGEKGFKMYSKFYNYINTQLPCLSQYNSTCKLILNYPFCNQSKYNINDIIYNKDLSNTFKILSLMTSDQAIYEFYNGTSGFNIVNTTQSKGYNNIANSNGLLNEKDLSNYRTVFREPISNIINLNNNKYSLKLLQSLLTKNENNLDLKLLQYQQLIYLIKYYNVFT